MSQISFCRCSPDQFDCSLHLCHGLGMSFWKDGLQFECQGSGGCCVSRGGYGFVWMTIEDRRRMSKVLSMSTSAFTKKYCMKQGGIWRLKDGSSDSCVFMQGSKCGVYVGRPTQCRTWPFWPETLNAKTWNSEVARFCPGVGKGRVWSREEIAEVLAEQKASEAQYGS